MPIIVCPDCKKERTITRIRKEYSGRCQTCAQAYVKTWKPNLIHIRKCIDCGDEKPCQNATAAAVKRCRKCNDKHRSATNKTYIRICIECGDERVVKKKQATVNRRCNSCAVKNRSPNKETIVKKKKIKKKKVIKTRKKPASVTILKKTVTKAREANKLHKEMLNELAIKEPPVQRKTDEEMVAEFYIRKKNEKK